MVVVDVIHWCLLS